MPIVRCAQFFARYFNLDATYNNRYVRRDAPHAALSCRAVSVYGDTAAVLPCNRFITLDSLSTPTEADVFAVLDSYVTDDAIGDAFFQDHWRMRQGG